MQHLDGEGAGLLSNRAPVHLGHIVAEGTIGHRHGGGGGGGGGASGAIPEVVQPHSDGSPALPPHKSGVHHTLKVIACLIIGLNHLRQTPGATQGSVKFWKFALQAFYRYYWY